MTEAPTLERLYTVKELAPILGVSTHTLYKWIQDGKTPAITRVNGSPRFKASDVNTWLECQNEQQKEETNGN